MKKKRIIGIFLATLMILCSLNFGDAFSNKVLADTGLDDSKIIIVSSNDAHCAIDTTENDDPTKATLGYAGVAAVSKLKKQTYSNVSIVDSGDHIQGGNIGLFTKGEAIIKLMNKVGYTTSTLGNHEFDYGLSRLMELTHSSSNYAGKANYPYVSCNFMDLTTNKTVYDPYIIEEYTYGATTKKVAYVGITTPATITISGSGSFVNAEGEYIYGFCQDETGAALYNQIQTSVDAARAAGADYVIAIGHVGQDGVETKWRSDTIVANISGIDAFIDGHSHQKYIQTVKDKDGKDVIISQTGVGLKSVGVMTIDLNTNKISAEIVNAPIEQDPEIANLVKEINNEFADIINKKVGETAYELTPFMEDDYEWRVRVSETNMGDLVADAFRTELKTDISLIGGGSVRNKFKVGDITVGDIVNVQPFNNDVVIIKATGQQIKDALELGAMKYPAASGGFLQVSGMTYEIATDIPSSVKVDNNGSFVSVEGEYRVRNIMIGGESLDLNKSYTIGGVEYTLCKGGDGFSMFKTCEVLSVGGTKDIELFSNYVSKLGVIPAEYANITGQGRIKFVKASEKIENKGTPEENEAPATGDSSKPMLYVVMMLVVAAGYGKKHLKKSNKC